MTDILDEAAEMIMCGYIGMPSLSDNPITNSNTTPRMRYALVRAETDGYISLKADPAIDWVAHVRCTALPQHTRRVIAERIAWRLYFAGVEVIKQTKKDDVNELSRNLERFSRWVARSHVAGVDIGRVQIGILARVIPNTCNNLSTRYRRVYKAQSELIATWYDEVPDIVDAAKLRHRDLREVLHVNV